MSPLSEKRKLSEFFSVPLSTLSTRKPLPFSLFLYLQKNEHVLIWRASGDPIEKQELTRLEEKGITSLWVPLSDQRLYELWLEQRTKSEAAVTPEGALIRSILLKSPASVPANVRQYFSQELGKTLLSRMCRAQTLKEELARDHRIQLALWDSLAAAPIPSAPLLKAYWSLSMNFPAPLYGHEVSSLALVLALAFNHHDLEWLLRFTLAALFQSIRADDPTYRVLQSQMGSYLDRESCDQILSWIQSIRTQSNPFQMDEASQLLSLAVSVENARRGGLDGQPRLRHDALKLLSEVVNPEIIRPVLKWVDEYSSLGKLPSVA